MTKIKKMRIERGLKAIELAQRLNISRSCVCAAEKKGLKNVKAAQRYAVALACRHKSITIRNNKKTNKANVIKSKANELWNIEREQKYFYTL